MTLSKSNNSIRIELVVAILFILLSTTLSVPLLLVVSYVFLFCFLLRKIRHIKLKFLSYFVLSLLLLMLFIPFFSFEPRKLLLSLNFVLAFFLSWSVKQVMSRGEVEKSIITALSIYLPIFFCVLEFYHIAGVSYNNILPSASRNMIGTIVLFCFILYSAFHKPNRIDFIFSFLIFAYSLILGGRSFQILSLLVFIYFFISIYRRTSSIAIVFFLFSFLVVDFNYLINSINFDSTRWLIINEYINSLTYNSFFWGVDIKNLYWVNYYNGNPHNSLILGHYVFGVSYLVFLFFFFLYVFLFKGTHSIFLLIIMLLKSFVDVVVIPSSFDMFFFLVLFFSSNEKSIYKWFSLNNKKSQIQLAGATGGLMPNNN